jgi:hypothetical protein
MKRDEERKRERQQRRREVDANQRIIEIKSPL